MPIEFHCPQCAKRLRTPDSAAGKSAKCPSCGTVVPIPQKSESQQPPVGPAPPPPPFGQGQTEDDYGVQDDYPLRQETSQPPFGAGGQSPSGGEAPAFPQWPGMQPEQGSPAGPNPYQAPQTTQPHSFNQPRERATTGRESQAIAGLVLGIIGLIGWCCPIIGFILGALAITFGVQGRSSENAGMATVGIVLGIITLVLSLINAIAGVMLQLGGGL